MTGGGHRKQWQSRFIGQVHEAMPWFDGNNAAAMSGYCMHLFLFLFVGKLQTARGLCFLKFEYGLQYCR